MTSLSRIPLHSLLTKPSSPLHLALRPRAPLTLLPPSRCLAPTSALQQCRYKSQKKSNAKPKIRKVARAYPKTTQKKSRLSSAEQQLLEQTTNAFENRDVDALMAVYPNLISSDILDRDGTRRIVQLLHTCVRNDDKSFDKVRIADVLPFIQQVINDLVGGVLPSHPFAFVHVLGIYKSLQYYDEGLKLWQWLSQQDDSYLSPAVYGAAIEILSYGNKMTLPELEALYVDALKRFPGTFAEYHLSPEAIVPDRGQPIVIPSIPMLLLQGIMTARLRAGDWRNAYLALDTALRLYPSQLPSRFFELFIHLRPLDEHYTVFLMACRAGIKLKPNRLTSLIKNIKRAAVATTVMEDRLTYPRAIANAIYAYQQAGGSLVPMHVGQFLRSFDILLPESPNSADYEGDAAKMRNRIVSFAHETLGSLLRAGMAPSSISLVSMVHLAGKLRVPDLLRVSLQDLRTARVKLDNESLKIILRAAGLVGDKEVLEEYWGRIATEAEAKGVQIWAQHWIGFIRGCRRAEHNAFLAEQLDKYEHAIPAREKTAIMDALKSPLSHPTGPPKIVSLDHLESELQGLEMQLRNIVAVVMSGSRLDIRTSPFYMFLNPERRPLSQQADLGTVYDECSIDPHQPPAADTSSMAALSATGIPLDTLRFENWVTILQLMDQAATRATNPSSLDDSHVFLREDSGYAFDLSLEYLRKHVKSLRDHSGKNPAATMHSKTPTSSSELQIHKRFAANKSPLGRAPRIVNYVSLQSDHETPAPATPAIARRPLGNRKSPNHHEFRQQGAKEDASVKESAEALDASPNDGSTS